MEKAMWRFLAAPLTGLWASEIASQLVPGMLLSSVQPGDDKTMNCVIWIQFWHALDHMDERVYEIAVSLALAVLLYGISGAGSV